MADEIEAVDGLSAEENAYFESKGEKLPELEKPAETEAAPEHEAKVESDEGKGKPDPQVPLRALTKEREEHKRLRGEFEENRRRTALIEDRLNQMLSFQQPQQPEKQEPPDPEKDIFAAVRYQNEQLRAINAAEQQRAAQVAQQSHEAQVEQAIWQHWTSEAEAFSQEVSDFGDAAKFLAELRDSQLTAFASLDRNFATKQGRDRQINAELKQVIISAHQASMSPAQAVYDLAKAYGYKGPAPKTDDPAKAVEKLAKAVEKEITLSGSDGSATRTVKTAEDVASMSGPEFEAWLQKAGEKGFKRLMQSA